MDLIPSLAASLLLAEENVERQKKLRDDAINSYHAAVTRRDQLAEALALVENAFSPFEESSAVAATPPPANRVRDRRAVNMTDASKLRGLRRIAWEILKDAGSKGISNDDFVEKALAMMTPQQRHKTAKASGGQRRAILDGHFALRKNARNFGITLEEGPKNHWTMRVERP